MRYKFSREERKDLNEIERNLGFVNDEEALTYAFNLLIWAAEIKKSGGKLARTDADGNVGYFLEQDKKDPAEINAVKPSPKTPKGP